MEDNILIYDIEFSEELYKKTIEENNFKEDTTHGIGEEVDGNS